MRLHVWCKCAMDRLAIWPTRLQTQIVRMIAGAGFKKLCGTLCERLRTVITQFCWLVAYQGFRERLGFNWRNQTPTDRTTDSFRPDRCGQLSSRGSRAPFGASLGVGDARMVQAMDRGVLALASVDHLCNHWRDARWSDGKTSSCKGCLHYPCPLRKDAARPCAIWPVGGQCRRGISLWPDFYSSHFGGGRRVSGSLDDADTLRWSWTIGASINWFFDDGRSKKRGWTSRWVPWDQAPLPPPLSTARHSTLSTPRCSTLYCSQSGRVCAVTTSLPVYLRAKPICATSTWGQCDNSVLLRQRGNMGATSGEFNEGPMWGVLRDDIDLEQNGAEGAPITPFRDPRGGLRVRRFENVGKYFMNLDLIGERTAGHSRHPGRCDRHHREGDERWSFDDAVAKGRQRHRCSQCDGTGIVDQFCRRHQTHSAGTEFSDFRECGRHRHRRRYSSDGAQKSQLVHRGDFGGLKSSAES